MPNWCVTSYTIVGKKADVKRIHAAVEDHPVRDSSDKDWQGNILVALGASYDIVWEKSMRGFLCEYTPSEDVGDREAQMKLVCQEAWVRTDFAEELNKLFPGIRICFSEKDEFDWD